MKIDTISIIFKLSEEYIIVVIHIYQILIFEIKNIQNIIFDDIFFIISDVSFVI